MGMSVPQDVCLNTSQSVKKCLKCSKEGVVHGSSKMAYCEDCFVAMVKGKFRGAISKRKIFRDSNRKVLVLLDGSIESAFLFRQVEDAVKQTNFKRLMIEPSFVLLISCMETSTVHDLEKRLAILRQALPSNYYIIHMAAVFGDLHVVDDNSCYGLQYLPKLVEFSNAFRTTVAREEAMRILRIRLLQRLSRFTGISKIMVPCNSDALAELMVAQLCLGRGGCVSEMTDVIEKTSRGTTFIRPLRDVTSAEIAIALRLENVEHYALLPELKTESSTCLHVCEASKNGSLQQMSSDFLTKFIEDGFKVVNRTLYRATFGQDVVYKEHVFDEGTVPTILGISSKVHAPAGNSRCSICEYSFTGKENICYACSIITNDVSPSFVDYICGAV